MAPFVAEHSIVRRIWGKGDTILFIFAGAAAEFALNKAVDWLYFTGKLPADPLGRLFSTVRYARGIVFASQEEAHRTIDQIQKIHGAVEKSRGDRIPDWAYRDVLFMLIHYSIASFELFERKLNAAEKEDVYDVFFRMGTRMELKHLPQTYPAWLKAREEHMMNDLQRSELTDDLFRQYQKHLGAFRYRILIEGQKLVVPQRVKELLGFRSVRWLTLPVQLYKLSRLAGLDSVIKNLILPGAYKRQIAELDVLPR